LNGPKSREETPKEGSDTRKARIPHRTNIAPQRTKFKLMIWETAAKANAMPLRNRLQRQDATKKFEALLVPHCGIFLTEDGGE
jgi:hypothetical protein